MVVVVETTISVQNRKYFLQQKYSKKLWNIFAQEGALGFREYLWIFVRFSWAIKIGVALEHSDLARVFEREKNFFHLKKCSKDYFGVDQKGNDDLGGKWSTWVKAKGTQVFKSIWKDSKTPSFKFNPNKNQANERAQKPGCRKPPPLRMNLALEIRLLGKTILDNVPLEILPVPTLILTPCDAPTELCKTSLLYCEWLFPSDPKF